MIDDIEIRRNKCEYEGRYINLRDLELFLEVLFLG